MAEAKPAVVPIAAGFAAALVLIHMLTAGSYGYFRDELYFLAWAEHLDWGYVDHAPMAGWILHATRRLLGDSLYALRLPAALAAGGLVLLTAAITQALGGGRAAVVLACLSVVTAPIYLGLLHLYSMNAFEPLFWMGGVYALILAIQRQEPKLLLWFGLCAGLGLMNKHSMVFFGFALVMGLLLTRQRRLLATRWMWMGAGVALLIFLPNLIWQYIHGWPTVYQLLALRAGNVNVSVGPLDFIGRQLFLFMATGLVWIPGLWFFLGDAQGRPYRFLGWAYLVILAEMMLLNGKHYYMASAYPMLLAGGAILWERAWWPVRALVALVVLAGGVLAAPMVLPVLPVEAYLRYEKALGLRPPQTENNHTGVLPQHFGDMFGWPEMVEQVARVYQALPPEERAKAAIFANNYGEAGAIDFFGPRYGLPKAISRGLSYWLWGPREYTGELMIVLGDRRGGAEKWFQSVEETFEVRHKYAMPYERYRILVCRGLKAPLREVWPKFRPW